MKNRKSRFNGHASKSKQERQDYGRFILSTKGKRLEGTDGSLDKERENSLSDTFSRDANDDAKQLPPSSKPQKKRKPPYKSWSTRIKGNLLFTVGGLIATALVSIAITTLWNLNREVGEVSVKVDELQNKYAFIFNTNDQSQINLVEIKTEIEHDFQYLKERIQRLEFKVFEQ